jgi:hypothetical protein
MKKILLLVLILSFSLLSAYKLTEFSAPEQEDITDYLDGKIYLLPNETIRSVEGYKWDITDANEDYWVVIDEDGEVHQIPVE